MSDRPQDDFSPEQVARGRALRRAQTPWLLAARTTALALALVLGLTPAGAWLVERTAVPGGGAWWARVLAGAVLVVVAPEVLTLPFAAGVRMVRVRFGLVTQGWAGWWADLGSGLLVSLPLAVGTLYGVYALAGVTRWWWAWLAPAAAVAVAVLSWLAPVVLEPVFNRFAPLPPGELREALLALAARDGIAVRDVLVADASRRTTAVNAYVSGFGRTRRVVVHDTLLSTAEPREVELVTAHELGHVKHRDVALGTLAGAVGAAVGVLVLAALVRWPALLDAAGVRRFADPRSVPLLAALAVLGSVVAGPPSCALSRRLERRADRHALDLTGDPGAFIAMQRRLTVANVADPAPPRALHLLFGTHPTPARRIAAARAYAARTR